MKTLRLLLLAAAVALAGILLGGSIYDSLVLVPNINGNIPDSMEHGRLFMHAANPGSFFRVISPLTQASLLLAVIFCWPVRGVRWWLVTGLVAAVLGDVLTFAYFYPRNALMFQEPLKQPVELLARTAQEWGRMNLVRIALVSLVLGCALTALTKLVAHLTDARTDTGKR